jgi:hypothetical protein
MHGDQMTIYKTQSLCLVNYFSRIDLIARNGKVIFALYKKKLISTFKCQ